MIIYVRNTSLNKPNNIYLSMVMWSIVFQIQNDKSLLVWVNITEHFKQAEDL